MRILIVDNEQAILVCLKTFLETPEMVIDTAGTLENAMRLIKLKDYDCVISDIRLRGSVGEEGLDILKFIKKRRPDTRVIIMTGYDKKEIKQKACSLGADSYFEKPVSANALLDTIMNFCSDPRDVGGVS